MNLQRESTTERDRERAFRCGRVLCAHLHETGKKATLKLRVLRGCQTKSTLWLLSNQSNNQRATTKLESNHKYTNKIYIFIFINLYNYKFAKIYIKVTKEEFLIAVLQNSRFVVFVANAEVIVSQLVSSSVFVGHCECATQIVEIFKQNQNQIA